ncbi:MAG TPA: glutathione transferase GstA [Woeseiaceae bacterium]|nr:glutathione transferase GstA [Woeseiaceae bacterium]
MKLYYAPGTCSLSPHIVAREAGIALDLERVDIRRTPHVMASGEDFTRINANAYVPVLELDDGTLMTEGVAIVQYLADRKPEAGLAPPAGTRERYQLQSWLTFVSSELHKMYSPWLFHPEYGTQAQEVARERISQRLAFVDAHLAGEGPFLMGEHFTAADAYLFTIIGWSAFAKVDLSAFPALRAFMERVGARPGVRAATAAERAKAAA